MNEVDFWVFWVNMEAIWRDLIVSTSAVYTSYLVKSQCSRVGYLYCSDQARLYIECRWRSGIWPEMRLTMGPGKDLYYCDWLDIVVLASKYWPVPWILCVLELHQRQSNLHERLQVTRREKCPSPKCLFKLCLCGCYFPATALCHQWRPHPWKY